MPGETEMMAPAPALGKSLGEAGRGAPQAGPRVPLAVSRLLVGQALAGIQEARAPVWRVGVAMPAGHLLRVGVAVHPRSRTPRCNSKCVPVEPHRLAAYRPSVRASGAWSVLVLLLSGNSHRPTVVLQSSLAAPWPN